MLDLGISGLFCLAALLMIGALRGLSEPETASKGLARGVWALGFALFATLLSPAVQDYAWIVLLFVIGGAVGMVAASKARGPALLRVVAAVRAAVGLATLLLAGGLWFAPAGQESGPSVAASSAALFAVLVFGGLALWGGARGILGWVVASRPWARALLIGAPGWAVAAVGFALVSPLLVIAGGVLGAAGTVLGRGGSAP